MKHKWVKIFGITALILTILLLIVLIAILARGGRLEDAFNLSTMFTNTLESSTASPDETTKAADKSSAAATKTTDPVVEDLPEAIRIGVGSFEGRFNPLYAEADGDLSVVKLTQLNLLTYDRDGLPVPDALETEYRTFKGTRYPYNGVSRISWKYDLEKNITTYMLDLKEGVTFSDGKPLTIDDVIFNYYLRLQPDYDGAEDLRGSDIVGLQNYFFNSSAAEGQSVTDEELAAELADPAEETVNYYKSFVASVLKDEKVKCEEIWQNYQEYGYGDSAQEFYFNLYGTDMTYNPLEHTMDEVCEYLIEKYGADYRLLAEHFAVDEAYFDDTVHTYVRQMLIYRKIREAQGKPVDSISGIERTGDYSMTLSVYGKHNDDLLSELFDLYILPLHYYGDPAAYNYTEHSFGIPEEGISEEKLGKPLGAGLYTYYSSNESIVILLGNDQYFGGKPANERLQLMAVGENALTAFREGAIDIAEVAGNRTVNESIREMNANDSLNGQNILTKTIKIPGYSYVGINANNVKVGDDPYSPESVSLRRGLATLFAYYRSVQLSKYYGQSITILDYPVSEVFELAPTPSYSGYEYAYSVKPNGAPIYTEEMSEEEKQAAVIETAKDYFIRAGYTYDEENGFFTEAPAGASMMFELMINGDISTIHPAYYMLDAVRTEISNMGLNLDIRFMSTEESMLVSLYLGSASLWFASWNTLYSPGFDKQYLSDNNIYDLKDEELDRLIHEFDSASDPADQFKLAQQVMQRVRSFAVEVPCCQTENYVLFNRVRLNTDTLSPDYSFFGSWYYDIAALEVNDNV